MAELDEVSENSAKGLLKNLSKDYQEKGIKGKDLYMPIRISITGETAGPEIYHLASIIGKKEVIRRIELTIDYLI